METMMLDDLVVATDDGFRQASVADLLAALIAEGGETWITKPTGPDGSHELCYAAEPGRYLVYGPIPVEETT